MEKAVEMKEITMSFGKVIANDHVNFDVDHGEIHALVGENGAGKSTLMNILYGLYMPQEGTIQINGKQVKFGNALDAIAQGIGMVHQHFMLIPRFRIVDNIALGSEPKKGMIYDWKQAAAKVEQLSAQYDMKLDPYAKVQDISLGMQQRVEIMKALYRNADILILDEPTAVLTPQEIDELGEMLKKLKKEGKTIIIITHKLQEVLDFSDRVTVLRLGKIVGTVTTNETTAEEITQMMVGRSVHLGGSKIPTAFKEEAVVIDHVSYHDGRVNKLLDVSLTIKKGEILGIAGIDNSGQKELTEVVAGVLKPSSGKVFLYGEEITGKPVDVIKKSGVGFVPQDRHKHGLALEASVRDNMILGYQREPEYLKHKIFVRKDEILKDTKEKMESYDIRPRDEKIPAKSLSGGNQQKIIIAREVSHAAKLIIADQPSRGVDIGAIEIIHKTLVNARNAGESVLLVSLELDEVMLLSDRIAVMHDGRLMGILDGKDATREEIGLMMAGRKAGEAYGQA